MSGVGPLSDEPQSLKSRLRGALRRSSWSDLGFDDEEAMRNVSVVISILHNQRLLSLLG